MVTSTNVLLSAYTSFLRKLKVELCKSTELSVNALSGLYLISTLAVESNMQSVEFLSVNALSGLYLISTVSHITTIVSIASMCQCPLGLIPHFYGTPSKT